MYNYSRGESVEDKCLEIISKEFCGDFEDSLYEYKSGPQLVLFSILILDTMINTTMVFHRGGFM